MIPSVFGNRWLVFVLLLTLVSFDIKPCQSQVVPKVNTPIAFMQSSLDFANQLRAKHQSGPLQLNISLSADAEAWAIKIGTQCDKVGKATAFYSRAPGVGENVWVTDSLPDVDGSVPLLAWYNQVQKHNWTNNIFNYETAQFSTLVWKATTQFGIAKIKTPLKGYIMVVARFLPQGNSNYYSSFAANVFPPLVNSTTTTTPATPTTTQPLTTPTTTSTTTKPTTSTSTTPATTTTVQTTSKPSPATSTPTTTTTPTTSKPLTTAASNPTAATTNTVPTTKPAVAVTVPTVPTFKIPGAGLTTPKPQAPGSNSTNPGEEEEVVFIPEDVNQSANGK